jgi:hypothetical protein
LPEAHWLVSPPKNKKLFRSPVGLKPYPGRDLVCLLLRTAAGAFEDFKYHREFLDGENAALEFSAPSILSASTPRADSWKSKSWCTPAEGVKALGNAIASLIGPQVKAARAAA